MMKNDTYPLWMDISKHLCLMPDVLAILCHILSMRPRRIALSDVKCSNYVFMFIYSTNDVVCHSYIVCALLRRWLGRLVCWATKNGEWSHRRKYVQHMHTYTTYIHNITSQCRVQVHVYVCVVFYFIIIIVYYDSLVDFTQASMLKLVYHHIIRSSVLILTTRVRLQALHDQRTSNIKSSLVGTVLTPSTNTLHYARSSRSHTHTYCRIIYAKCCVSCAFACANNKLFVWISLNEWKASGVEFLALYWMMGTYT